VRVPADFIWGVATASYQIEGSPKADGKGESIWDRFSHTPGKTRDGETADVACDHYRRYAEDVDLMADLGIEAYRFSIAWPRIYPQGTGQPNARGIAFYERLVDRLLERGIRPVVTVYHWDLPQALQDRGGWANRDTVGRYVDYAETVFRALGDRVSMWITHNEPWVAAFLGHYNGEHAPGITDLRVALASAHHLLLSHAGAVDAYRALGQATPIGISLNLWPVEPASDRQEDAAATTIADGYQNRWFLDPLFRGAYPQDVLELWERLAPPLSWLRDADLAQISRPIDFLGVNYYTRSKVRADRSRELGYAAVEPPPGTPMTTMPWEITPETLTALLVRLKNEYGGVPLYITENGAAFPDRMEADGTVHDPERVEFLGQHFLAALRAIEKGVDLRGYFVWSLMDNFEWAKGYGQRFGIVYVDYPTQRRIAKDSARFYQKVIADREVPDEPVAVTSRSRGAGT
jgi:beta-glucosidase